MPKQTLAQDDDDPPPPPPQLVSLPPAGEIGDYSLMRGANTVSHPTTDILYRSRGGSSFFPYFFLPTWHTPVSPPPHFKQNGHEKVAWDKEGEAPWWCA